MRSALKASAAAALSWSGMHAVLGKRPRGTPLVLGYHRVVEDLACAEDTLPGMAISARGLQSQLEWIARRFRVVTLDQLGARLERGERCDELAAITFDDGYQDVYDHGLPVLDRLGLPAAIFVVTGLVGTRTPPLHDRLYQLAREGVRTGRALPSELTVLLRAGAHEIDHDDPTALVRALLASAPATELSGLLDRLETSGAWSLPPAALDPIDWPALARMHEAGITIGSHTQHHALLSCEDDESLRDELERSRQELEAGLAIRVRHFAYPDGRFSPRVVRAVSRAGYRFGYTICTHRDPAQPLLTLPRVMLWEGSCRGAFGHFSPSLLRCHASALLPFGACRGEHRDLPRAFAC